MKKGAQLPEAQLTVMQIIWREGGSIMFSELMALLKEQEILWKPNTVLTLLSRLTEREILEVHKHGRLNEYVALISENEYLHKQTKSFVDSVFGGDAKHLISALVKQDYISQEDYRELESFWDGKKG